jgi:hypothetical protein
LPGYYHNNIKCVNILADFMQNDIVLCWSDIGLSAFFVAVFIRTLRLSERQVFAVVRTLLPGLHRELFLAGLPPGTKDTQLFLAHVHPAASIKLVALFFSIIYIFHVWISDFAGYMAVVKHKWYLQFELKRPA